MENLLLIQRMKVLLLTSLIFFSCLILSSCGKERTFSISENGNSESNVIDNGDSSIAVSDEHNSVEEYAFNMKNTWVQNYSMESACFVDDGIQIFGFRKGYSKIFFDVVLGADRTADSIDLVFKFNDKNHSEVHCIMNRVVPGFIYHESIAIPGEFSKFKLDFVSMEAGSFKYSDTKSLGLGTDADDDSIVLEGTNTLVVKRPCELLLLDKTSAVVDYKKITSVDGDCVRLPVNQSCYLYLEIIEKGSDRVE